MTDPTDEKKPLAQLVQGVLALESKSAVPDEQALHGLVDPLVSE